MSLAFLLPLGLAALAAWLVPLLIHLHRRTEHHRTAFAALRWLQTRTRPRSNVRIEEWPLLLARLVLLAALALLLAQPVLFGASGATHWQVFAPGVDPGAIAAPEKGVERRWLAPGFPTLEEGAPKPPIPVGSLLRELDALLPEQTRLTVVLPARFDGADAALPALRRAVDWQVVETSIATPAPARASPRPPLAVRYAQTHTDALRYFRAAAVAWRAANPASAGPSPADIATASDALPPVARPLVWLASGPLPPELRAWIERGGTALIGIDSQAPDDARAIPLWRSEAGEPLIRGASLGRGRVLQWTQPLTPDALPVLLEPEFPERLWQLFAPPPPAPTRVAAVDYTPLETTAVATAYRERPRDLQPWLLLAVAIAFLIERWLASGRRVRAAA